jgi:hypothetical protein
LQTNIVDEKASLKNLYLETRSIVMYLDYARIWVIFGCAD